MSLPTTPQLKWLFTAHFSDGTTIVQDQDDKCLTRSDGSGSAFTDVLAREDDLVLFELGNEKESVLVDLVTGNFSVNGISICLHNQYFEPTKYRLKLVYFRETRAEQVIGSKLETIDSNHYINRYFIGWETVVNGKNKQVTLAVG